MASDGLSRHFEGQPDGDVQHPELRERITGILKELGLPFQLEADGGYLLPSKYGDVYLGINNDGDLVTLSHFLGTVENHARKKGDFYAFLLRMNTFGAAKFCFGGEEEDKQWDLLVIARLNAETLDAGDLEWNLQSLLDMVQVLAGDD